MFDGVQEKAIMESLKEDVVLYKGQTKQLILSEPF